MHIIQIWLKQHSILCIYMVIHSRQLLGRTLLKLKLAVILQLIMMLPLIYLAPYIAISHIRSQSLNCVNMFILMGMLNSLRIWLERISNNKCVASILSPALKFDGWPWKTKGHLFCATLSFVHHLKAIGEFELRLQSGNAEFGSKSAIFLSRVTLKFDVGPWKTIGHLFYVASSFVHHFIVINEF